MLLANENSSEYENGNGNGSGNGNGNSNGSGSGNSPQGPIDYTNVLLEAADIQKQGMEAAASTTAGASEKAMSEAADIQKQGMQAAASTTAEAYKDAMSEVASKLSEAYTDFSKAYKEAADNNVSAILTAAGKNVEGFREKFFQGIKDYAIPLSAIGVTFFVSWATNAASDWSTTQQVNATIEAAEKQSEAMLEATREQIAATLKAAETPLYPYVANILEIRGGENPGSTSTGLEYQENTLLKSNSFTVLRLLQGQDKGTFLRFLAESGLIEAEQPEISLSGANLSSINLKDAWLPDISLEGSYMLSGDLHHVDLTRANLQNAVLEGTNFEEAVLVDADLTNAEFKQANLTNANLTGATLINADFTGANLKGASIDVDEAIQQGATFCDAMLPSGKRHRCS